MNAAFLLVTAACLTGADPAVVEAPAAGPSCGCAAHKSTNYVVQNNYVEKPEGHVSLLSRLKGLFHHNSGTSSSQKWEEGSWTSTSGTWTSTSGTVIERQNSMRLVPEPASTPTFSGPIQQMPEGVPTQDEPPAIER